MTLFSIRQHFIFYNGGKTKRHLRLPELLPALWNTELLFRGNTTYLTRKREQRQTWNPDTEKVDKPVLPAGSRVSWAAEAWRIAAGPAAFPHSCVWEDSLDRPCTWPPHHQAGGEDNKGEGRRVEGEEKEKWEEKKQRSRGGGEQQSKTKKKKHRGRGKSRRKNNRRQVEGGQVMQHFYWQLQVIKSKANLTKATSHNTIQTRSTRSFLHVKQNDRILSYLGKNSLETTLHYSLNYRPSLADFPGSKWAFWEMTTHVGEIDLCTVKVMSQLFGPNPCGFLFFLTIRLRSNITRFSK